MSEKWYLYKDQQQQGPLSWEELIEKNETGVLEPADMVWTEGMDGWFRADQVEGLVATAPPAPPDPVFNPPPPPGMGTFRAKPPGISPLGPTGSLKKKYIAENTVEQKTTTGLEPNIAGLLCYLLGWITGIIFFLVESENRFVRFHAMQSIVTFGGLTVLQVLINIFNRLLWAILWRGLGLWSLAGTLTTFLGILSTITWLAALVLAVILMVKAYQNELFKLPVAGKIAERQFK